MAVKVERRQVTDEALIGERYRWTAVCRGPYWPDLDKRLLQALNGSERFQNWLDFTKVTVYPPSKHMADGRNNPYTVEIEFHKVGPGSPLFIIIGAIVLVIVATVACVVVSHSIEKLADSPVAAGLSFGLLATVAFGLFVLYRRG